jgi:hypothetical protein
LTKGIAYEGLKDFDKALETYLRASDFIEASQFSMYYYSVQQWITKIMYRLCMLSLRLQEHTETLHHFRRYKHFVDTSFTNNFTFHEKVPLYYWYWRTLSDILKGRIEGAPKVEEKAPANGDALYNNS